MGALHCWPAVWLVLTVKPVACPTCLSGGEEYYTTKYLKVKPVVYTSMSYVVILSKLTELVSALDLSSVGTVIFETEWLDSCPTDYRGDNLLHLTGKSKNYNRAYVFNTL